MSAGRSSGLRLVAPPHPPSISPTACAVGSRCVAHSLPKPRPPRAPLAAAAASAASAAARRPGRRRVPLPRRRVGLRAAAQATISPPSAADDDDEEPSWLVSLRESYHEAEMASVVRIMMAMGGSKHVEEMHRVLAQECTLGPLNSFYNLIWALNGSDQSGHAVKLFYLVEPWFRQQVPRIHVWEAVIQAMALAERLEDASKLIQDLERGEDPRLPSPTADTYAMFMLPYGGQQGPEAAAALFSRMSLLAVRPSPYCYLHMVCLYCRLEPPNLDMAKMWLGKAEDRMLKSMDKEEMRRTVWTYNTLMAGYARSNMIKEAFSLLGCMRTRGLLPDTYSFHILQCACLAANPFGVEEVRQLLRLQQQIGVEPTTENYNVLIQGYGVSAQLTSALRVANRMREAGVLWNSYTYFYLIQAVITSGQVELSLRLLAKMRKDGARPRAEHYTVAFVGLAGAGFYEDATRVFRRLASLKDLAGQYAYNMMIAISCRRGEMATAVEVQQQMEEEGMASNAMTYRMLLEGYELQQEWEAMLSLQEPIAELKKSLQATLTNPAATEAARKEANTALNEPQERKSWQKIYWKLIDASVWAGQWSRGVELLEEMIEQDLRADFRRHARLFEETKPEVRNGPAAGYMQEQVNYEEGLWAEADAQRAQSDWIQRTPSSLREAYGLSHGDNPSRQDRMLRSLGGVPWARKITQDEAEDEIGSDDDEEEEEEDTTKDDDDMTILVPPHLFCASFSPDWLSAAEPDRARSMREILQGCMEGETLPSTDLYRLVHDYHHATVHRRGLANVRVEQGSSAIVRTVPETPETLQNLFDGFGQPGSKGAPVYIFLRPASASLDALLALLAHSALQPTKVLLMRPNEPDAVEALVEQCKERGEKALSASLISLLAAMPVGALINSRLLLANTPELKLSRPGDLELLLRKALGPGGKAFPPRRARLWREWLQEQQLTHLVRANRGEFRLDGLRHKPFMTKEDLFRVRATDDRLIVDMKVEEEDRVVAF